MPVQFEGLDELVAAIANLQARIPQIVNIALDQASALCEENSQRDCPVRTGFLKASESREVSQDTAIVAYSAYYAGFVEFGTSRMAPRYYLKSGFEAASPVFIETLGNQLEEAIRSA